uniref:tRNA pseudouridine synthase A n=1 Tax=candidate division WOR-3 bacterium TaxID=2052148 RepID=A0A7C4CA36_UNCW3
MTDSHPPAEPPAHRGRCFRLILEFDGAAYAGWQFQPNRPTVQGALETALCQTVGRAISVTGCSRTDSGVSARNYVASFTAATRLTPERLRLALNSRLPEDIFVKTIRPAPAGFNARYAARGKVYSYLIVLGRSPLRRGHAWEFGYPLDIRRLRAAARLFPGRRDFRHFCQTRDADGICTLTRVSVRQRADEIVITVAGDRFLYKMVRRIVGALVACGSGRTTLSDIKAALAGRPHAQFQTAPARGLLLESVRYPAD